MALSHNNFNALKLARLFFMKIMSIVCTKDVHFHCGSNVTCTIRVLTVFAIWSVLQTYSC